MLNRKYIFILLLLIVSICAISTVSAADDAADDIAASEESDTVKAVEDVAAGDDSDTVKAVEDVAAGDDSDTVKAVEDVAAGEDDDTLKVVEDVATNEEADDNVKLASSQDSSKLSVEESGEVLASGPPSMLCSVNLNAKYEISAHSAGYIKFYLSPSPSYMPYEAYHFYVRALDDKGNVYYNKEVMGNDYESGYYTYTIAKDSLRPGKYVLKFINQADGNLLDSATLLVKGSATIKANNYYSNYKSGAKMTATITDSANGKPLTALKVKVVFTKGKKTITKYYKPNYKGQISFVPPIGVGTWYVKFTPAESHVSGALTKKATYKKSKVVVKALKVVEYKGFKTKLKATVKTKNGKKVNEGKVLFKINGKKYRVNVKNGVAVKYVKLYKIKKYKYSAVYLGSKNLYKSKVSKAKAFLLQRSKVKIYAPNPSLYVGQKKYYTIKVKTADGRKVKNGWLKVQSKDGYTSAKVKNGVVKVIAYSTLSDVYVKSKGDDSIYKKSVTKKFKIKYVPGSHKYMPAKTKYKATTKFVCHCGKTYTHGHTYMDAYYYIHSYTIYVI